MKKQKLKVSHTVFLLTLLPFYVRECPKPPVAYPTIIYVDAINGNDEGGIRGDRNKPFQTIQAGINQTKAEQDTVLVLEGTYNEDIVFRYKGTTIKSESGPEKTILQGTGEGDVVKCGIMGCTFQGFTVTGGKVSWQNAGIYSWSDLHIFNNIITGNGHGIFTSDSHEPLIVNNLIYRNSYSGIYAWYHSNPTIVNNTVVFNGSYGIYVNIETGNIMNNIIYANDSYGIYCRLSEHAIEISFNNVFVNRYRNYQGCSPGEGSISVDPLFENPDLNNLRLVNTSLCLGAASMGVDVPVDIENKVRPNPPFSCPDMGAYENPAGQGNLFLTMTAGTGGTTIPSPGTHDCCEGTKVGIEAVPYDHYMFINWTGDVPSEKNHQTQLTFMMDVHKSIMANFKFIHPPLNCEGQKVLNRSLSQVEYINVLTWEANPNNENKEEHYVYLLEEGMLDLLAKVSGGVGEFMHRRVEQNKPYTYAVAAIIGERVGAPMYITVQ